MVKIFKPNSEGWFCGWWNDSQLQINSAFRTQLYHNETLHYHKDFYEYYIVIEGFIILQVEKKEILISKNEIAMVEPMEKHQITKIGENGCHYISIKSKSYKKNKIIVND